MNKVIKITLHILSFLLGGVVFYLIAPALFEQGFFIYEPLVILCTVLICGAIHLVIRLISKQYFIGKNIIISAIAVIIMVFMYPANERYEYLDNQDSDYIKSQFIEIDAEIEDVRVLRRSKVWFDFLTDKKWTALIKHSNKEIECRIDIYQSELKETSVYKERIIICKS